MPVYTIIDEEIKEAGEWSSLIVIVPESNYSLATLHLKGDGRVQPPPTTEMFWIIEKSDDGGQTWNEIESKTLQDNSGIFFSQPVSLSVLLPGLEGNHIQSRIITDADFRFGIDLEVI